MIYRSAAPDVRIPDVSLNEYVLRHARDHADKVALIDASTGERLTYGELADGVTAAATGLARLGVRPGDVVALISHNQPRFALAVHAVLAAGAVVTPVNPVLTTGEIAKQFAAAKVRVAISSAEAAEKTAEVAAEAGVEHRFVLGDEAIAGARPFAELLVSGGTPPRPVADPHTALAALPFSSGTTGFAKGVMLTHRNLVANLEQCGAGWRIGEDEVLAAVMPFFHIYGFTVILNAGLRAGATIVTLARYDMAAYLRMVQDHGITRAFMAPPMIVGLAATAESLPYDLSSLRYGISAGAPLDADMTVLAEKRLGCLIRQGYGMTETSPGTHLAPDAESGTVPPGSVGRLVPSTEARLVDAATGQDAAPGQPGELWIRGPQVMAGYLDNPAATKETIAEGGWLRTGDIVRIDDGGNYWVVDRLKELIKYKGYQVAPAELEALLLTHPDVLDAAVVGVPHLEGGEAPKAFVVAAAQIDPAELLSWVSARVAPYKKVREIEFIDTIPKSPSGKILRRLLKDR